uniref:7TM_GPCR_Srx domain-containing protein n=1 Tax=Parastrongyloides trichosuri TaxID=131310 RepID=A0A0N5A5G1_PARTI
MGTNNNTFFLKQSQITLKDLLLQCLLFILIVIANIITLLHGIPYFTHITEFLFRIVYKIVLFVQGKKIDCFPTGENIFYSTPKKLYDNNVKPPVIEENFSPILKSGIGNWNGNHNISGLSF